MIIHPANALLIFPSSFFYSSSNFKAFLNMLCLELLIIWWSWGRFKGILWFAKLCLGKQNSHKHSQILYT